MGPDRTVAGPGCFIGLHADLMFVLAAMLVPAILALPSAPPTAVAGSTTPPPDRHRGATIVADAEGLRLPWLGNRRIPVAAVTEDAGLRSALAHLRTTGTTLQVLIEPAGLESAFLLEPVLAAHGPETVMQIRSPIPCAAARTPALAGLCAPIEGARSR